MSKITCFLPCTDFEAIESLHTHLNQHPLVQRVYLLVEHGFTHPSAEHLLHVNSPRSSEAMRQVSGHADSSYSLIFTRSEGVETGLFALDRLLQVAEDSHASMVYADYSRWQEGVRVPNPVIDYQEGSVRDDFDFGPAMLFNSFLLRIAVATMHAEYQFAGLYDLRLKVSQRAPLVHINETLFGEVATDLRKSGEKQFDYVDPRNRAVQLEMEQACTSHLKQIGAWLEPDFEDVNFEQGNFTVEASVIIPVRNRVSTIEDAIRSVLRQVTSFPLNLIIVDNHSTDGTTDIIRRYAAADERVVLIVPKRDDLGIGGCWNEGVHSAYCGKFAVQLDSDDVYKDSTTLQTIVDAFYDQKCAMVVGSYTMTNFKMETIPPGLIDHKEWTPENGRNNALRINGLGAPRAFYTPVLRDIKLPNTSYGEDYAVGLAISRRYRIGRIYTSLYLCRRWDENSDASLDISRQNAHNAYKDKLRTIEIMARKRR